MHARVCVVLCCVVLWRNKREKRKEKRGKKGMGLCVCGGESGGDYIGRGHVEPVVLCEQYWMPGTMLAMQWLRCIVL